MVTWMTTGRLLTERARSVPRSEAAPTRRDERRERAESRVLTAPLRRRVRDAETRMAALAAERAAIEARLADPALYQPGRGAEVIAAQQRLAEIGRAHEGAELAWLEAEEALEAAE